MTRFCDETLDQYSIYVFLHRERECLFPDEAFADLFDDKGRRSVRAPSVVVVVMVPNVSRDSLTARTSDRQVDPGTVVAASGERSVKAPSAALSPWGDPSWPPRSHQLIRRLIRRMGRSRPK